MMTTQSPKKPAPAFTPAPAPTPPAAACGNGKPGAPTHAEIARCAYDIYIEHGRAEGRSQQDWLQAEEELAQTQRAAPATSEPHFRF